MKNELHELRINISPWNDSFLFHNFQEVPSCCVNVKNGFSDFHIYGKNIQQHGRVLLCHHLISIHLSLYSSPRARESEVKNSLGGPAMKYPVYPSSFFLLNSSFREPPLILGKSQCQSGVEIIILF